LPSFPGRIRIKLPTEPKPEDDPLTDANDRPPTADEQADIAWWNSIPRTSRAFWLGQTESSTVAEAWDLFKQKAPQRPQPDGDAAGKSKP
jgi:hypothetical protein